MRTFATFGFGPLGSISFEHAIHALPADRPHGVAADCWIPLDGRLGLVIGSTQSAGPLSGYFMVKQGGAWQRLALKTE